ncbi:MAG: hypothetical protein ACK4RK_03990 [Gemmataceae bacterium]
MTWLLLATGFTGGMCAFFWLRWSWERFHPGVTVDCQHVVAADRLAVLVAELRAARREALVQVAAVMVPALGPVLLEARGRQVQVEVLCDDASDKKLRGELAVWVEKGLTPRALTRQEAGRLPLVIIDRKTVILGTGGMENENQSALPLLLIKGQTQVADSFRKLFQQLKEQSRPLIGKTEVKMDLIKDTPPMAAV